MRYEDVVAKLRLVSQSGRSIRLVVARVVSSRVEEESGVLPEINDVRRRLTMLEYDVYETRKRVTYTCGEVEYGNLCTGFGAEVFYQDLMNSAQG